MGKVYFKPSGYDRGRLVRDAKDLLALVDQGTIRHGQRVLIKPNLLAPAPPEKAMTTHPLIIRAAAEYALDMGARVQVSDSCAVGSFEKVCRVTGTRRALAGLDIDLRPLENSVPAASTTLKDSGGIARVLELSEDALSADVILNLPKLKTHTQMGLTLAVKNLFGCVVGMRKPEWHYRVGTDKERFAALLVTIHSVLRPRINLMDGILAMEGLGPGTSGTPRRLGMLLASKSALDMDRAVCTLVGLEPDALLTNRIAAELEHAPDEPEIEGRMPEVPDFKIPETGDLIFGPKYLDGITRKHILSRPVNIPSKCRYCNECVRICPARAIENRGGRRLVFDYEKCIRCYCCLEVCPHSAMRKHDTFLKRIIGLVLNR